MNDGYQTFGGGFAPTNYSLTFYTDFTKLVFKCEEIVHIVMKKRSKTIILNSRELKIQEAYAEDREGRHDAEVKINEGEEKAVFGFKKSLSGSIKLHIRFEGINNDKMYGFYRSTYRHRGKENTMLTTQFEPADARSAFVCFDEPSLKATFDVALVVDEKLDAISNMPIKSVTKLSKGKKMVRFLTTPKMSTYLLYLGVGKFDRVSTNLGKLKISALTIPGKKELARLSLSYARLFIDYYQKYFGIKFPLPKIDMIGVPDFSAGAMENWGAITFREVRMLGDEKKSSISMKQSIAEVVAHELAHQWFGNLVTMRWWNDIWLNESFAEFMSYKAQDVAFPEWEVMKQYYMEDFEEAISADAQKSTHPISMNVKTPGEISGMFDAISYEKGGTVLYMLEHYAGREVFREGLHSYLKKHMYSSARREDLWREIDIAAKKRGMRIDVSKFAHSWITKKGHPIIDVSEKVGALHLSQKRFTSLGQIGGKKNIWPLPLEYIELPSMRTGRIRFSRSNEMMKTRDDNDIKLNYGVRYLCRVRYPTTMRNRLGRHIKDGRLGGIDALELERECFTSARIGISDIDDYIDFVGQYCMDVGYPAYHSILLHLEALLQISNGNLGYEKIRDITEHFSLNLIEKLGWEPKRDDTNIQKVTRTTTLSMLGRLGNAKAVDMAEELFSRISSGRTVDMEMAKFAITTLSSLGDIKRYKQFVNMYEKATVLELRDYFLTSLGNFDGNDATTAALKYSLSKKVRKQDTFRISYSVSKRFNGYKQAWAWTMANWETIDGYFPAGTHMIQRFIQNAALMHTKKELKDFLDFTKKVQKGKDDIKKAAAEVSDEIRVNIRFFKRNKMV